MTNELPTQASAKELPDIQGGLIGFNKDLQTLIYVNFPTATAGQAFLAALAPLLARGSEVLRFNGLYKAVADRGGPSYELRSTWINLWLSFDALTTIEAPNVDDMPDDFKAGMAARKDLIGDSGPSDPSSWLAPFADNVAPHCVVVVAADVQADLDQAIADIQATMTSTGVTPAGDSQVGQSLAGGREHFGFKDGISQPGILGLTTPSKQPHEEIAAGEFLIGYVDEQGQVSGQAPAVVPPPLSYDPAPQPPPQAALPPWCRNGSFVVLRRLRQDVAGFRSLSGQTPPDMRPEQLQAKLVGRWPTGAPMEHVAGMPKGKDPSEEDLSEGDDADKKFLDANHVNNFDYSDDADGALVPRAAHIRKVNPRSDALPDGDTSRRHRMLRRGVPYGPTFQPEEPPYGAVVPPEQDRGLVFVCYQASIADGFEFVQRVWANAPNFQQASDGEDPIISQDQDPRTFRLPRASGTLDLNFAQWVQTTGGGYYFSPSVSAIQALAQPLP